MKYVFVLNPAAGKNNKILDYVQEVQKHCKKQGASYEIHVSESGEGIISYVKHIGCTAKETVRIYAVGGDGTLNNVVNGAIGFSQLEIGVIPMGTGNDFVKNIGVSLKDFFDIEKQLNGISKKIDVIAFGDQYCVNMVNIGFDARVGLGMPKFKGIPLVTNKMAYNLSVAENVLGKLGRYIEVYADDKTVYKGELLLTSVANGKSCGGGFYTNPNASVDDGFIDVCMIKAPKKIHLATFFKNISAGTHVDTEPTKSMTKNIKCKKLRIRTEEVNKIANDGEECLLEDILFEVKEQAISFIVPN
ncbi:MAG: YegS/Rv2252/BmrU family lipid kinase [Lachnospiraceae bacterium]